MAIDTDALKKLAQEAANQRATTAIKPSDWFVPNDLHLSGYPGTPTADNPYPTDWSWMMQKTADDLRLEAEISSMRNRMKQHEADTRRVAQFREHYLQVRTNNIVLDHQSAIELVRMIYKEADTLTVEDTM